MCEYILGEVKSVYLQRYCRICVFPVGHRTSADTGISGLLPPGLLSQRDRARRFLCKINRNHLSIQSIKSKLIFEDSMTDKQINCI